MTLSIIYSPYCLIWPLTSDYLFQRESTAKRIPLVFFITMTSWWARWRLKSPASQLFTQPFISRCRSKKTSKLRVTGLTEGNSPVSGEFPTQRANNAEMFPFDNVIMFKMLNTVTNGCLRSKNLEAELFEQVLKWYVGENLGTTEWGETTCGWLGPRHWASLVQVHGYWHLALRYQKFHFRKCFTKRNGPYRCLSWHLFRG